ncbi:MAG TPA: hypothetical protein VH274_06670 [Mycobacteriales bacterium]|nr:hypothetical protein [Mycobacteriales bacterium]
MKRLLVVAAAVSGVLSAMPEAGAAPGAPTPTVSVSTAVNGQPLPVSSMRGSWSVKQPGRRATLQVSGPVATGTVTTVRSTWISSWRTNRPHGIALDAEVEADFQDVANGSANNCFVLHIDVRTHGHHWQNVGTTGGSHSDQLLFRAGQGIGVGIGFLNRVVVQWRVRVTATFYDTSDETLTETVKVG